MKFAFLIMGHYDSKKDIAAIDGGDAQIIGVADIDEACAMAQKLYENGVECVELCGAFEETGAKKIIDATGGKLAVGYVVHLPEQDALFERLFGKA